MKDDIHTMTGAYVLDALSAEERAEFTEHLRQCATCGEEVVSLRETAAILGAAAAEPPPAELKQRVLTQTRRTPQVPSELPTVIDLRAASRRRPSWIAAVAAAACLLLAAVFGVRVIQADRETERAAEDREQVQLQLDEISRVLTSPDTKITTGSASGGVVTVVLSHTRGKVALLAHDMPALPPDRAYQAWLIGPAGPRSAGLLTDTTQPDPLLADLTPDASQIGLTVEPIGGSLQPTTTPVVAMALPT